MGKTLPIRKLTPAQMQESGDKGLCFIFDGKFTRGHRCPVKSFMLIVRDWSDEEDEEEGIVFQLTPHPNYLGNGEGKLEIFLNAVFRCATPSTIRSSGTINKIHMFVVGHRIDTQLH